MSRNIAAVYSFTCLFGFIRKLAVGDISGRNDNSELQRFAAKRVVESAESRSGRKET